MAWYNFFRKDKEESIDKLNPAQHHDGEVVESSNERTYRYQDYYEKLEAVNRGVNMLVDDASEIPANVGQPAKVVRVAQGVKKAKVDRLLNYEPNPFQDISTFKRNLIIDYIMDGNIFIYYDGVHLYHLPSPKMSIKVSAKTYVDYYEFNKSERFEADEIIHIKDNSFDSIYRGTSRLKPLLSTMQLLDSMKKFQTTFFDNGAVPGLVLKSPNTLSDKIKSRMIAAWAAKYNPKRGGRRPMILDGGLEIDSISNVNFKELDFQNSITENEKIIFKALGIPPVLIESGNNANIRPNLRLYYLETVLPIVKKLNHGFERFFGYEIREDITGVPALQPELRDQSQYYTSLVNGGIIVPNEAREALGMDPITDDESMNEIRIPANIAGSAGNPDEGGRPNEDNSDDNDS